MRVLKVKSHLSATDIKKAMNSQQSSRDFKDWQIICSVQSNPGKKALEIAEILCVTENKVYKTVQKYNKLGSSWKSGVKLGGRREKRCIMPLEKEKEFLKIVEDDALKGQFVSYHQIKSKLESQIDRRVSDDYIWDLFKRHGWSKKMPRPSHPQADKEAQDEFKKNSRRIWLPNH
jgi:transposase